MAVVNVSPVHISEPGRKNKAGARRTAGAPRIGQVLPFSQGDGSRLSPRFLARAAIAGDGVLPDAAAWPAFSLELGVKKRRLPARSS